MAIRIQLVRTAQEAEAVFRLRYEVYVEELQRTQRYADHVHRTIEEPLDQSGHLWAAIEDGEVVGTLRNNYSRSCALGEYADLYEVSRVGTAHAHHVSISTKLLVAAKYRNTSLAYRLSVAAYRQDLDDGIFFNFIDVYPARVPFFERLGFCMHVPAADHSEFGRVAVMKLSLRDADHLRRVGSPFLRYLKEAQAAA